jgi:hypothetical protein
MYLQAPTIKKIYYQGSLTFKVCSGFENKSSIISILRVADVGLVALVYVFAACELKICFDINTTEVIGRNAKFS